MTRHFVILLVIALTGCSPAKSRDSAAGSSAPPEEHASVIIRTHDAQFKGGASLEATTFPTGIRYELVVNGRSPTGEVWAAGTQLDIEMLGAGRGSVSVQAAPAAVGGAFVQRQTSPASLVQAAGGLFEFELAKGRISGAVTAATPGSLDATFEGTLVVVCYVPATGPSEGGGTVPDDASDSTLIVLDEKLENPACEAVRPWAPAP